MYYGMFHYTFGGITMSTFNFHLLTNQHGERFIFYRGSDGEKLIDNFSRIPYTAENLFDDIKDEFSSFPWADEDWDNEYNENDVLIQMSIDDFTLGDEKVHKIYFSEIASIIVSDEAIHTELHTLKMNEKEKHLFQELKSWLKNYCSDKDIKLCVCDDTT